MKSVLVVDDDQDILSATADAFECGGYQVVCASSGEDALRILGERADIGFVLMDVQMPGLTGTEVVRIAANDLRMKRIPFILMTAALGVDPPGDCILLRKPFSLLELLCLAASHLGGTCPHNRDRNCVDCEDSPKLHQKQPSAPPPQRREQAS